MAGDEWADYGQTLEDVLSDRWMPWRRDAAGREHPELNWFPERGESTRPAKAVCDGCLVRSECLAWALDHEVTPHGVWGGLSPQERSAIRADRAA